MRDVVFELPGALTDVSGTHSEGCPGASDFFLFIYLFFFFLFYIIYFFYFIYLFF